MKLIKSYKELQEHLNSLKVDVPPFSAHFEVSISGCFNIHEGDIDLQPDEALRLGKWLVKFYGGEDDVVK